MVVVFGNQGELVSRVIIPSWPLADE